MPRWRQDPKTHKLIPIDAEAAIADGLIVSRNFEPFRSPIDGSIIRNQRQYDDHCRKHNVVPAAEFSDEFYKRKEREREAFYNRQFDSKQKLERKREIYEAIVRAERNAGW